MCSSSSQKVPTHRRADLLTLESPTPTQKCRLMCSIRNRDLIVLKFIEHKVGYQNKKTEKFNNIYFTISEAFSAK